MISPSDSEKKNNVNDYEYRLGVSNINYVHIFHVFNLSLSLSLPLFQLGPCYVSDNVPWLSSSPLYGGMRFSALTTQNELLSNSLIFVLISTCVKTIKKKPYAIVCKLFLKECKNFFFFSIYSYSSMKTISVYCSQFSIIMKKRLYSKVQTFI